jgi:selT/selW/selH-like putative selenoprotein
LAAEIDTIFDEGSQLIQSSGGVFEVERNGVLIYSKQASGRFPEDGEVIAISKLIDDGMPLAEAQAQAGEKARHHPSFGEWLNKLFKQ